MEAKNTKKRVSVISPEIEEVLKAPNPQEKIKELFVDVHPHDIFALCEDLEDQDTAQCIKALGIPVGIELFEQFDDDRKKDIFECFSKEWMADILEEMAPDERVDFVKYMPEEKIEVILPLVARAERNDINRLIKYEEGTAGSIFTTEYASLLPNKSNDLYRTHFFLGFLLLIN